MGFFLEVGMNGHISKPTRRNAPDPETFPGNELGGTLPSGIREQAAHENENAFSLSALLERVDHDHELLKELVDIFRQEYPRYSEELRQAVAKNDLKQVATVGHALKGMFANLAAERAAALAADLERLGRGTDSAGLQTALKAFETECAALLPVLDARIAEVCR